MNKNQNIYLFLLKNRLFFVFKVILLFILIIIPLVLPSCKDYNKDEDYDNNAIALSKNNSSINNNINEKEGASNLNNRIILPPPVTDSKYSLEKSLSSRRSVRSFIKKAIELEKISQLLWAAQGITEPEKGFRTSPSAGALYPLDVFLLNDDGIFHYLPDEHILIQIDSYNFKNELFEACLLQNSVLEAPVVIIITAYYEKTTSKYGQRGERYVLMEAGHACQNILLQAVAIDLGAVPVGAFDDNKIRDILGTTKENIPLYVIPVGYPE